MTRDDVERLLHCARHEAQGAGPNTLAEVCEWGLERAATCDLIANEMRKRCEAAEAKLAKAREALRMVMEESADECLGRIVFSDPCWDLVWAALSDEEPAPAEPPCGGSRCHQVPGGEWIHSSKSYGSCAVCGEGGK